jgi:hypothetical protein
MRETLTDLLGALAVLLIAAAVGAALYEDIGWWSYAVSGGVLLLASELSAWRNQPKSGDK